MQRTGIGRRIGLAAIGLAATILVIGVPAASAQAGPTTVGGGGGCVTGGVAGPGPGIFSMPAGGCTAGVGVPGGPQIVGGAPGPDVGVGGQVDRGEVGVVTGPGGPGCVTTVNRGPGGLTQCGG